MFFYLESLVVWTSGERSRFDGILSASQPIFPDTLDEHAIQRHAHCFWVQLEPFKRSGIFFVFAEILLFNKSLLLEGKWEAHCLDGQ